MQSFNFYNPTHIVFGAGRVSELAHLVPTGAKVMVLYGGNSARQHGTLDEVEAALSQHELHLFGGIEPNPSYQTLMRAVVQVQQLQIDFLLAVGGGSVIDGTKFVAAAACFAGDNPWDILQQGGKNITQALPFASVLTLPATGSEMNRGGVITNLETKSKRSFSHNLLYPQFSILDPTKTYSLPDKQVANGVVDAFVHVMEQYLTYPTQAKVQDRFAEGLLQTLIEIGLPAIQQRENYELRANLMWTATLALNGLIGAGVPQDWSTHMIGHELTALYGLDHAQTLAIILPSMLEYRREPKQCKLLQYAERVWGITDGAPEQRISQAIANTRDFFESLGVATRLRDYGLDETAIEPVIEQLRQHGMLNLGEHRDLTPEDSQNVLRLSL
ncbi:iron-containing alcohol dehydrogenase [Thiopseudomonas alkaliphila]|uniref:iron-containing alcohol dehydrogenase n=1 Tax=Thiopseudomonas alkaliphila TaxID=1697053 RepID=UPI002576E6A4|nr:iron-containing alcohol dehydrogenase [Thiopseudomonas alkaliphila]MDM1708301.1 iron-containing alcohol dehydrogenase [Thiopseudomonas alkaliphila]